MFQPKHEAMSLQPSGTSNQQRGSWIFPEVLYRSVQNELPSGWNSTLLTLFRYLSPEWLDKNHWFPIAKPPKMVRNKTHWAKRVSNDMQWYATMVMDHERPWKTIIRGLPPVSLEECGYHVVPVLMILLPKFEARFGIFVNIVAHFSDKIWSLN